MGIIGFIVDAGVLFIVAETLGPYLGRLLSFGVAVITTWALNHSFTFKERKSGLPLMDELGRYFSAMIVGGIANYSLYAALVYFVEPVATWPTIGVAAGSIAGLVINFTLARNYIFNRKS